MSSRKTWQDFKKRHPNFERHKSFKSDVGPQLDKLDAAKQEVMAAYREASKKRDEVKRIGQGIVAALKGYEEIVKQLEAIDNTVEREFRSMGFDDFENICVQKFLNRFPDV